MKVFHIARSPLRSALWSAIAFATGAAGFAHGAEGESLVLQLRHRGPCAAKESVARPDQFGVFEKGGELYYGEFLAVDWQGCLYFSDPVSPGHFMLKRFSTTGRLLNAWGPIVCDSIECCCVTKDGRVWVGAWASGATTQRALPVVVYDATSPTPVTDWRRSLPQSLAERLDQKVVKAGEPAVDFTKEWIPQTFECSANRLSLRFVCSTGSRSNAGPETLWILLSADDWKLKEAALPKKQIPHLSADDRIWLTRTDFTVSPWGWKNLWLWLRQDPQPHPLVKRNQTGGIFPPELVQGSTSPPAVLFDVKHVFLAWRRGWEPTAKKFEYAVTVLNGKLHPVTELPWRPGFAKWLKPAPDGRGFYRYEYGDDESRVYFHPLER